MKTRRLCLTAFAAASLYTKAALALSGPFVAPAHGIAFDVPAGCGIEEGFGDEIAEMRDVAGGRIRLRWLPHAPASREAIAAAVARETGGAMLEAIEGAAGGRGIGAATFSIAAEGSKAKEGIVLFAPLSDGAAQISCLAPRDRFIELFFECRALASQIAAGGGSRPFASSGAKGDPKRNWAVLPSPEMFGRLRGDLARAPRSFEAAARLVAARSLYALLDGRASCPGVADEPRRFAAIAEGVGNSEAQDFFLKLSSLLVSDDPLPLLDGLPAGKSFGAFARAAAFEEEGREEEAGRIYKRLAKGRDGHFARLALMRIALADEDIASAGEAPRGEGSNLAIALGVRAARIAGDVQGALRALEAMGKDLCGLSGAIAAHEAGLAVNADDPALSARLFRAAIEADPSYAPAYASLGRLELDGGAGRDGAMAAMREALSRAPDTPEIRRLKAVVARRKEP